MPASKAHKEYRTFVKGIITEASALTFPEDASTDEANFVLNSDGSRQRRLGIDYEANYALSANIPEANFSDNAITTYTWNNILGQSNANIVVVQVGSTLYFYNSDNASISANKLTYEIDLSVYGVLGAFEELYELEFSEVRGYLVVVGEAIEPFFVGYIKDTDTFYTQKLTIQIRDHVGLDDGLPLDETPGTLSDYHNYNLLNQGWSETNISAYQSATTQYPSNAQIWTTGKDASDNFSATLLDKQDFGNSQAPRGRFILDVFDRVYSIYSQTPGKTISDWSVTNTTITLTTGSAHGINTGDVVRMQAVLSQHLPEDSPTSFSITGYYTVTRISATEFSFAYPNTLDDFTSAYITISGSYTLYSTSGNEVLREQEDWRVSSTTAFGGRAFYSGLRDSKYSNYIFFSKILEEPIDLEKCYTIGDPTSEFQADPIASDGGYIVLSEAAKIQKLVSIEDSIIVFATNGVWQIIGDIDGVFSSLEYTIRKISDTGSINKESIVVIGSSIMFWSEDGINVISPESSTGKLNIQNISENTIQTLYLSIPSISRLYATGVYDKATRKVRWLYNDSSTYDGATYRYKYTKELIFDVALSAFFVNNFGELASLSPYPAGYIKTSNTVSSEKIYDVYAGGTNVLAGGEQVQIGVNLLGRGSLGVKYLTVVPQSGGTQSKITFSEYSNLDFLDWETADSTGIDAPAYMVTGQELLGDTTRDKQIAYLSMHFNRTETGFELVGGGLEAVNPSSCLVQARWGTSDSSNSGRWSTQAQMYRLRRNYIPTGVGDTFDYGFSTVTTKNKVRGWGHALALRIDSEAGKDMHILGWGVDFEGRSNT